MFAFPSKILHLPAVWKSPWQRYALAVAAFAVSFVVRYQLFGHLYGDHGYTVFIPAVVLTTLLVGVGPGLLTMVLSGAANWYAFIPASWGIKPAVALATYAATAIITIILVHWLRLAVERLTSAMASKAVLADRQSSLFKLADKLHRAETEEQVLDAALDGIMCALHCDRASILLRDASGVMRFVRWRHLSDAYRKAVDGHSPWAADEADPRPVCIDDVERAEIADSLKMAVRAEKVRALAFIPITSDRKPIGKFMAYYDAPHNFTAGDMEVAIAIAQQLQLGIQKKRSEEREKLLIRELQHRTKNIFSVVQALAHLSLRGEDLPKQARDAFVARLRTLARAEERLATSAWNGMKLDEVVRSELEPFAGRFEIRGGEIILNPEATQNFALAVHELATNASKYGALSADTGKVIIGWTNGAGALGFRWEERHGPAVSVPTRNGFGSALLKATLGDGRTSFAETGLVYEVDVPLAGIVAQSEH